MNLRNGSLIVAGLLVMTACGQNNKKAAEADNLENAKALSDLVSKDGSADEEGPVKVDDNEQGPTKTCESRLLDFDSNAAGESIAAGTVIAEQYAAWGVLISAVNGSSKRPDLAITFDSANPHWR